MYHLSKSPMRLQRLLKPHLRGAFFSSTRMGIEANSAGLSAGLMSFNLTDQCPAVLVRKRGESVELHLGSRWAIARGCVLGQQEL